MRLCLSSNMGPMLVCSIPDVALVNDELRVDVVASWCFTRLHILYGHFKLFYCKVARQVGVGGGALESEVTSHDVQRVKYLSACGKCPLFRSCEAMTFAVTGHLLPV